MQPVHGLDQRVTMKHRSGVGARLAVGISAPPMRAAEAAVTAARKFLSDGCRNDRCREREERASAPICGAPGLISRTLRVNLYHEQRAAFTVDGAIPQLSRVDALIDETKGPPQAGS